MREGERMLRREAPSIPVNLKKTSSLRSGCIQKNLASASG